jgi:hypothetical protein
MGQPTANDPAYRAAMGQPTVNDPGFQAAMGQPRGNDGAPPYGMMNPGAAPLAKKGCCGCLSVLVVIAAAGAAISLAAVFSADDAHSPPHRGLAHVREARLP